MIRNILQSWNDRWPEIKSTKPLETGKGVVDQAAFNTIEIDQLFDAVNQASSVAGQSVLYRSLTEPSDSIEQINAKQQAINEIKNNPATRENLERIVTKLAEQENSLYVLLFGEFLGSMGTARETHQIEGYGYNQYCQGVRFMRNMVESIYSSEIPESPYLKEIFGKITAFSKDRIYSLMIGPVYNTERGLKSKEERKGSFVPATIFKPSIFKPLLIAMVFFFIWLAMQFIPDGTLNTSRGGVAIWGMFLLPISLIYFPIIGSYDRDNCIIPLRNEFKDSQELGDALDAFGQLDELLCFIRFSEKFGSDMVLPSMINSDKQMINLVDIKNPVLGMQNEAYVGNDFTLKKDKLVFITGPNSGGKTAFCKTITQVQILAQAGCFVPAKAATLSVADKVFYQAPEISHLDDGEGRFGTELKRTKDIFLASTAKSLVVLDELSEGTTFEEKMESSSNVLDGFYRKGCNTILITHNHQLVDVFADRKLCLTRQVEFSKDHPTFKLVKGISRVSHADRVAKKIGFSKEDIDGYLADSK